MPRKEDLSPKERAKKFKEGTYTATQTGARGTAQEKAQRLDRMKVNREVGGAMGTTSDFEDYISGKKGR